MRLKSLSTKSDGATYHEYASDDVSSSQTSELKNWTLIGKPVPMFRKNFESAAAYDRNRMTIIFFTFVT